MNLTFKHINTTNYRKSSATFRIKKKVLLKINGTNKERFSTVFTTLTLNIEQFYELRNFG